MYDPVRAERNRRKGASFKTAVLSALLDLDRLINKSALAKQYLGKTHGWFSQKLHRPMMCDRQRSFSDEELRRLSDAYRDIARRLAGYDNDIDNAQ